MKMGKKSKNKDDETSIEETMAEAEAVMARLDDMMAMQHEKIDAIVKKASVYSVLWILVAAVVYYVWPTAWYYWIPAILAVTTIASLIFALVMRRKMPKD